MGWAVETLDETVDMEVEALPEDMRARLARIAKLIEEKGLERVRDAAERPQRNFARAIRDSRGPARGDRAGIREEDGENAAARDRSGLVPREVDAMMEA